MTDDSKAREMSEQGIERVANALWASVEKQTNDCWPLANGPGGNIGLVDDTLDFAELARATKEGEMERTCVGPDSPLSSAQSCAKSKPEQDPK